ncbi:conjugal transfer protein [Streptomyces sp. GbtcB6]|uniref:conjugal transfer protein n=1 Tax=Streptomyces sp. GbtcB6 TaxID=2824751 RepID=UPI001C30D8E6|nr:conjugal transfer protein [Streptomyces sp. GbtcB6]
MTTRRELTWGQALVLGAAAVVIVVVGGFGAWGTYTNAVSAFHRQATAAGVVAAGEGLTLILALIMLGRTMLGMASPAVVRGGMWLAPLSASCIGLAIASSLREGAVYAVTPLAMSGAAEGLGLIARSIVVYRTGEDAEVIRRNGDVARQLAYQRAVADGHPDKRKQKRAVRSYWRLAKYVGVGDAELGAGLVDVQRVRVRDGADAALASMYGAAPTASVGQSPTHPRSVSATEKLRNTFAAMDPEDAIRFAADARPDADAVELAVILATYGLNVDPVAVALVLGQQPPEYTVERPDAPAHHEVSALPAVNLQGAVEEAASALGETASPREIAEHLEQHRRLVVDETYIRTALSRAAKKTPPEPPADKMEGGYA